MRGGRQRQATKQADRDEAEDRAFEGGERGEIRRHPFRDDRQQLAEIEDVGRAQQRAPAIGRDAGSCHRGDAEQEPAREQPDLLAGIERPDRLQRHRADQREAEHEAAMKVRPQRHQRQPDPGRRDLAVGRIHENADPRDHHRQRQDVRPRQDMMQRQQHGQHREQHRAGNLEMRVEQVDEDRGRRRDRERGEDHRPGPVPLRVGDGEQDLRQPGRRDPWFAGAREGIEVGIGQGLVIEDPLPDLDLPERVGVLKQRVADIEEEQIGARADTQRYQRSRAALHRNAVGEG